MITVDDGIRKLKLLDAKGKVWTQDMILQVDDKAVSLVDLESKVRCPLTPPFPPYAPPEWGGHLFKAQETSSLGKGVGSKDPLLKAALEVWLCEQQTVSPTELRKPPYLGALIQLLEPVIGGF